jgi:protein-disulfide isomerase
VSLMAAMMKSGWAKIIVLTVLGLSAVSVRAAVSGCPSISADDRARLIAYVSEKYDIPESVKLSIKEVDVLSNDCYRKLRFSGEGPLGPFSLELYLSPNLRFLTPDLLDSYKSPKTERKEKAEALMGKLTAGDYASLGNPDAPVTVVVFSDFQCPYCKKMAEILKQEPLVRDGNDVRVVFRNYPLSQHAWAQKAAVAAGCAQFQNAKAFWAFHDSVFAHQQEITDVNSSAVLDDIASQIPVLDYAAFSTCVQKEMSLGVVLQDKQMASALGVSATPTVFINGIMTSEIGDPKQFHEKLSKIIRAETRAKVANF